MDDTWLEEEENVIESDFYDNESSEFISDKISNESILTSEPLKSKSASIDLAEHDDNIKTSPSPDDSSASSLPISLFTLNQNVEEEGEYASEEIVKLKGRAFPFSFELFYDSDSAVDVQENILPKISVEPLLLREVISNYSDVEESEHTDRLKNCLNKSCLWKKGNDKINELLSTLLQSDEERELYLKSYTDEDCVTKFYYSFRLAEAPNRFNQLFLIYMCQKYDMNNWDLVLHGKKVEGLIGNRICDDDIPTIFEFVSCNEEISYVDLSYNEITSSGLSLIALYLMFIGHVTGLNLMNNNIQTISTMTRAMLGKKSNLEQLRLNGNKLLRQGRINSVRLLKYNKLVLLDVGETSQNLESIAWLVEVIQNCSSIKVLDISRTIGRCGYHVRTYHLAIKICDLLKYNSSLVELHLQKNNLNDFDVEQIMVGVVVHPCLEVLDLSCNNVCDLGAEYIAKSLENTNLVALILSSNQIRNNGARALSLKIPMSKIAMVNLSKNKIADAGMIDLFYCFTKTCPLEALFIHGNPFTAIAIQRLNYLFKSSALPPNCVDVLITVVDGAYQTVFNPMADRYKARYYHQYEFGNQGVWRWNGTSPMYYGIPSFQPTTNITPNFKKFPTPTAFCFKKTCGV